jgi:hypothetical protein
MKRLTLFCLLSSALLFVLVAGHTEDVAANGGRKLEVTVTNVTKGQIFSPTIVVSHSKRLAPLFELGAPARPELATLAEEGMTVPLHGILEGHPKVKDVVTTEGMLFPGESVSVAVRAPRGYHYITLASMLVSTNDAFLALKGHHSSCLPLGLVPSGFGGRSPSLRGKGWARPHRGSSGE